jgi:hypothetical protein
MQESAKAAALAKFCAPRVFGSGPTAPMYVLQVSTGSCSRLPTWLEGRNRSAGHPSGSCARQCIVTHTCVALLTVFSNSAAARYAHASAASHQVCTSVRYTAQHPFPQLIGRPALRQNQLHVHQNGNMILQRTHPESHTMASRNTPCSSTGAAAQAATLRHPTNHATIRCCSATAARPPRRGTTCAMPAHLSNSETCSCHSCRRELSFH